MRTMSKREQNEASKTHLSHHEQVETEDENEHWRCWLQQIGIAEENTEHCQSFGSSSEKFNSMSGIYLKRTSEVDHCNKFKRSSKLPCHTLCPVLQQAESSLINKK